MSDTMLWIAFKWAQSHQNRPRNSPDIGYSPQPVCKWPYAWLLMQIWKFLALLLGGDGFQSKRYGLQVKAHTYSQILQCISHANVVIICARLSICQTFIELSKLIILPAKKCFFLPSERVQQNLITSLVIPSYTP